jgi:hypothetical protein
MTIWRRSAAVLIFVLLPVSEATANNQENAIDPAQPNQEERDNSSTEQSATQRLDFGIDFYDSVSGRRAGRR